MDEWIVEGGAVVAVLGAAGLMLRFIMARVDALSADYRRLAENHISHSTAAMVDLKNAIQQLTTALNKFSNKE